MGKIPFTRKSLLVRRVTTDIATRPTAQLKHTRLKGIYAALASAMFMGLTPVFGKQAILLGASPLAVVALRTLFAALLMLILLVIYNRNYLFIYPAGLLGCLLAGWINGVGSLFYYSALGRIDASLGHLIYSFYPLFLVFWLLLDHQRPGVMTIFRLLFALPAIYLLTQARSGQVDLIGLGEMLVAAALYALHIPINQRVLYDMPAPTVTLYTLLAMSSVVVPAYLISGGSTFIGGTEAWRAIIGLTLVTFLSRLMLFLGVKHLGGMQTALLGLSELLVAILFSYIWLGERFSQTQWIGAGLLIISLMMVFFEKHPQRKLLPTGWLSWLHSPGD
jgi:drug/metabolite transporter (DMT)-like permease